MNFTVKPALSLCAALMVVAACSSGPEQELPHHVDLANHDQSTLPPPVSPKPGIAEKRENTVLQDNSGPTRKPLQPRSAGAQPQFAVQGESASATTGFLHRPTAPLPTNTENYAHFDDNPLRRAAEHPVSTFSIDVDTGAYANVRRLLNQGQLPPEDAVRVEELINYFDYDYAIPPRKDRPFGVATALAPSPWDADTHLLQIGIQGWTPRGPVPPSNLVFLIDVSGSMNSPDKLPLLQSAMKLLVRKLDAQDRVAIVVYAGAAGAVLETTPGDQQATILGAIDRLRAGGSTNGGDGIRLAYSLAEQGFIKGGVNRVLLASDGDFNVGTVNFEALIDLVEEKRNSGVALTTLGFGSGNYNDHLVEQLANKGNGNYAYIDNLAEAQRVLVDNRAATLQTIAKDVKIQIEFNPASVAEYRLIGYENRALAREDFNNDKVDAGEIGAGHSVTALYEIALAGGAGQRLDPLRYGGQKQPSGTARDKEIALLRLRYKAPDGNVSELIESVIKRQDIRPFAQAGDNLQFAAAVAGFGQLLRGGRYTQGYTYRQVMELAGKARGQDSDGRRGEFLQLVQLADGLSTTARLDSDGPDSR